MKNIFSARCCAILRTKTLKTPTLFCGGGVATFKPFLFSFLFLLAMLCFVPDPAFGQQGGPGSAWTAGIDFQSNSPVGEDTWAFDAVEMGNGDFVVVGYAETNAGVTRVPAYAVLDKFGALKHSVYYDYNDGAGAFAQIAKTADGKCVMAGWQGPKAVLTKLDASYNEMWMSTFDLPVNDGTERLQSIDILPNTNILLSGGFRSGANPHGGTFFVTCDSNGQPILDKTAVFSDVNGKILDCKTVTVNGSTYVLATGFKIINAVQDWKFEVKELGDDTDLNADDTSLVGAQRIIQDWDVLVAIFNVDDIGPNMSSSVFKYYNSKDFDYQSFGVGDAAGGSNNNTEIWAAPSCASVYGPCTPGRSAKTPGWGTGSVNGSPVVDRYLGYQGAPRPCFVSKDAGRSIAYANGFVYVAAEMNTFEMTGSSYSGFHRNGQNGVELRGLDCDAPDDSHRYGAYKDAHIHLLKFNLLTGQLVDYENVAHCSGGDFYATIVADQTDGKIVLATTTADRGLCGLPPIDDCEVAEAHLLMKIDPATLQPVWQQHYLSDAEGLEGSCAFGLIQTADGGFVIVGNNELEGGDETFTIVKFSSDCVWNTSFDVGDYTVPQGPEIAWSQANMPSTTRVKGLITVPSGATLSINGITVEFVNSQNIPDLTKSGIVVQPGGKLKVQNGAVLKGLSICGPEQMWDGIIALGNPQLSQTLPNQAFVEVTGNSRVENALRGTVLGNAAWATEEAAVLLNGTVGTVAYHNYYETYTHGGSKLTADNAIYRNCGKGVVWNPYSKFSNLSLLKNAHFECTAALADPSYRPFNTALGEPTSTETFCEIQSNRGIRFDNCTALNTAPASLFPNPRNKPSGIFSIDGQFRVSGTSTIFQNLYVGITAGGAASGIPSAISVLGAHFANCYQGTNLVGTMATEINGCTYGAMPNTAAVEDGDAAGIFCTKATAYALKNNVLSGNTNNYGMVSRLSGLNGALIEGNTLSSFNLLANLFEYDNSALQTHCNTYQGAVGDVSWDVKGALANQGNPLNPLAPKPDNRFLWECDGPLLDIRNSHSVPFTYFERGESPANTNTIVKCTQNVTIVPDPFNTGQANCVIEDPCPNPPYCNSLVTNYNNSGYALPYRNDLLNAYVRMSPTVVADSLYLPSATRGITLLAERNQQIDKRMLVATYAAVGDYTNAQQYLQQVTGSDTETQDFIAYYTMLVNAGLAGRDAYQLTAAEFAQLAPLMTHSSSVSDNVKTLDHILNGVYHPLKVDSGTGGRPSERSEESIDISSIEGLRVLPNPFENEVGFFAPEWGTIKDLIIFDVSGKTVYNQSFGGGESMLVLNTVFMPQGVLFYRCQLSDGRALRGKIIHSSKK